MRLRAAGLLLAGLSLVACTSDDHSLFIDAVETLEGQSGGRIGVYALDLDTGTELAYRADQRFAMASTFKPLLVAAVLAGVANGELELDDRIGLDGVEVQPYSPVIDALGDGETLTIAQLSDAATTLGDNTATNMLLSVIGGPAKLTAFLRTHGDTRTRLDRYEIELNSNLPGDDRDTTTPRAMVHSLQRMLSGDVLTDEHAVMLQDWMVASTTGKTRLRAGLPADWRVGDKTGTGMNGAANNVAVAWPPKRSPVIMAVYMTGSEQAVPDLNAIHAEIAALIVAAL